MRIIGLSIDESPDIAKKHVLEKGWTSIEHYHIKTVGCTAYNDYGVKKNYKLFGIPHVCLADKNG